MEIPKNRFSTRNLSAAIMAAILLASSVAHCEPIDNRTNQPEDVAAITRSPVFVEPVNMASGMALPKAHSDVAEVLTRSFYQQLRKQKRLQTEKKLADVKLTVTILAYQNDTLIIQGELHQSYRSLTASRIQRVIDDQTQWSSSIDGMVEQMLEELFEPRLATSTAPVDDCNDSVSYYRPCRPEPVMYPPVYFPSVQGERGHDRDHGHEHGHEQVMQQPNHEVHRPEGRHPDHGKHETDGQVHEHDRHDAGRPERERQHGEHKPGEHIRGQNEHEAGVHAREQGQQRPVTNAPATLSLIHISEPTRPY